MGWNLTPPKKKTKKNIVIFVSCDAMSSVRLQGIIIITGDTETTERLGTNFFSEIKIKIQKKKNTWNCRL